MSDKVTAGRIPAMPKAVQMPPYPYQRDARSGGGSVAGVTPTTAVPAVGILRGSNLCS